MTEVNRENLSAGMDGQLTKEELRFLLRRFEADASLAQAWSDYHLARDGLRRELPSVASEGFAARVMLAIDQESASVAAPSGRRRWLRWSAGGAIAASVAVVALLTTQPAGQQANESAPPLASMNRAAIGSAPVTQPVPVNGNPVQAPVWLNSYASLPSQLSQQASATIDGSEGPLFYAHSDRLSPYQLRGYQMIRHGDASYLLISPVQAQRQVTPSQGRVVAQ
ncbi:sigma-E factor negative regulatory protein [Dyella sp.]|uniref:sigma-E factor negative regulatory protein n=1 Tax=Dyella sp. TaxID=1869338 RepID=UPI002ED09CDA